MRSPGIALVLLLAVGVLVACRGTSTYVPAGEVNSAAATSPVCNGIPAASVPGHHVLMVAGGTLKGSAFTGSGVWILEGFAKGTPGPTPTPGVTPTPLKGQPLWLYYGSYKLKIKKEQGCAFLVATKSGKPFPKTKYDATFLGTTVVKVKYLRVTIGKTEGLLTAAINGVSPTSGTGAAQLKTRTGGNYDTATISIVGRVAIP